MSVVAKPIHQQVLFITGASSGIGLATVKLAVALGARVFMVARNEEELQKIQDEMRLLHYETAFAVADVAEFDQLQFAADQCIKTFGRIDTWINNAGITIFSRVLDTTEEEAKRLFDTNFWGVVNGCKVAIPFLKQNGGTIINIGSVLSKVSVPLQGIYSAAEHAIKGFTDALRKELKEDRTPISISLVTPGAVDTPFLKHARSHVGDVGLIPPVYTPEAVARVIIKCACKPINETGIGPGSFLFPLAERIFRRKTEEGARHAGNMFLPPQHEGEVRGDYEGPVIRKKPNGALAGGISILAAGALILRRIRVM